MVGENIWWELNSDCPLFEVVSFSFRSIGPTCSWRADEDPGCFFLFITRLHQRKSLKNAPRLPSSLKSLTSPSLASKSDIWKSSRNLAIKLCHGSGVLFLSLAKKICWIAFGFVFNNNLCVCASLLHSYITQHGDDYSLRTWVQNLGMLTSGQLIYKKTLISSVFLGWHRCIDKSSAQSFAAVWNVCRLSFFFFFWFGVDFPFCYFSFSFLLADP